MVQDLSKQMEAVLKSQIKLMDEIYSLQRKIYGTVLKRDWENTKNGMSELDGLSERFCEADKRLASLIAEHGQVSSGKSGETIESLIAGFTSVGNATLENLYKTLKEKVLLSKIENDVFNNYIDHARTLISGVFDVVSHNRSGETYTRMGVKADSDLSNLVVNRVY